VVPTPVDPENISHNIHYATLFSTAMAPAFCSFRPAHRSGPVHPDWTFSVLLETVNQVFSSVDGT
jgi:hypothetical protein